MICAKCEGKVHVAGRTTHWYECENCGPIDPKDVLADPVQWKERRASN